MQAAVASIPPNFLRDSKRALRSICPQFVLNWRERGFYERFGEVELHLVEYLCRPGQDAIDIGANDGCYIHFMKPHARTVYAFEPLPWLAQALRQKFTDTDKVVIREVALSNAKGATTLYIPVVDGTSVTGCSTVSPDASASYPANQNLTVAMTRLDDVYDGRAGFIKIDVEGHEESVIEGGIRTITASRPRLLVELVERLCPGAVMRVTRLLEGLGYASFFVFKRKLLTADRFDAQIMQNDANYPALTASLKTRQRFGNYVYNFLFIPLEEADATAHLIRQRIVSL